MNVVKVKVMNVVFYKHFPPSFYSFEIKGKILARIGPPERSATATVGKFRVNQS